MTFELTLESEALSKELTKDLYVSVRVGDAQKLSKFSTSRTFRFPKSAAGDRRVGKVELFRRIAGHNIEIHSAEQLQEVPFEHVEQGLKFQVSCQGVLPAAPDQNIQAKLMKPKAAAAKEYMDRHALELRLSEAMQVVLRERPEDPIGLLCEILKARPGGIVIKKPLQQDKKAAKAKANGFEEKKTPPDNEPQGDSAVLGARAPVPAERALLPNEQEDDSPEPKEAQPNAALDNANGKEEEEAKKEPVVDATEAEATRGMPEGTMSPKVEEASAVMPEEVDAAEAPGAAPQQAAENPVVDEEEQEWKEETMPAGAPVSEEPPTPMAQQVGADVPTERALESQEWKEETMVVEAPVSKEPIAPLAEPPIAAEADATAAVQAELAPEAQERKEEEATMAAEAPISQEAEEPAAPVAEEPPLADADKAADVHPADELAPETQERKEEEATMVVEAPVTQADEEPAAPVAEEPPLAEADKVADELAPETQAPVAQEPAGTPAQVLAEPGERDDEPAEVPLDTQAHESVAPTPLAAADVEETAQEVSQQKEAAAAQEVLMASQEQQQATRERPFQTAASVGTWYMPLPDWMWLSADEDPISLLQQSLQARPGDVAIEKPLQHEEEVARALPEGAVSPEREEPSAPMPEATHAAAAAAAEERPGEEEQEQKQEDATPEKEPEPAAEMQVAHASGEAGEGDDAPVESPLTAQADDNVVATPPAAAEEEAAGQEDGTEEPVVGTQEEQAAPDRPFQASASIGTWYMPLPDMMLVSADEAPIMKAGLPGAAAEGEEEAGEADALPSAEVARGLPMPEEPPEEQEEMSKLNSIRSKVWDALKEACARGTLQEALEACSERVARSDRPDVVNDSTDADRQDVIDAPAEPEEDVAQLEVQPDPAAEQQTEHRGEPAVDSAPPPDYGSQEEDTSQQVEVQESAAADQETGTAKEEGEPAVDSAPAAPPHFGVQEEDAPQQAEAQETAVPEQETGKVEEEGEPAADSAAAALPHFSGQEEQAEVSRPSNQEEAQPQPPPPPPPEPAAVMETLEKTESEDLAHFGTMEADKGIRESDELEDAMLFEDFEQERTSVCGMPSDYSPKSTVVAMQVEAAMPPAPPPSREKEPRRQKVQVMPVSNLYGSGFHRTGVAHGLVFL